MQSVFLFKARWLASVQTNLSGSAKNVLSEIEFTYEQTSSCKNIFEFNQFSYSNMLDSSTWQLSAIHEF